MCRKVQSRPFEERRPLAGLARAATSIVMAAPSATTSEILVLVRTSVTKDSLELPPPPRQKRTEPPSQSVSSLVTTRETAAQVDLGRNHPTKAID